MKPAAILVMLACIGLGTLSFGALDASAYREPLFHPEQLPDEQWLPDGNRFTDEEIEGACGLAFSPSSGSLYLSDYYHNAVATFTPGGTLGGSFAVPGADPQITPIKESNSVCGLAADGSGNLYSNYFHGRVVRLLPSEALIDLGYATGVAVDEAGNLYVDHRTYVSVYDVPVEPGEEPAEKIGEGSLGDAYGIAIDSKAGKLYVADASDQTVKVYEPTAKLDEPVKTIDGPSGTGFNSLTDATLAVDTSKFEAGTSEGEGHLLVVDNLKPEYERPAAAVYEFDSTGAFKDSLQTRAVGGPGEIKKDAPIFGEPSGIAVDSENGWAFVTTGNSERSNVLAYGPFLKEAPASSVAGEEPASGGGASSTSLSPSVSPESSPGPAASLGHTEGDLVTSPTAHRLVCKGTRSRIHKRGRLRRRGHAGRRKASGCTIVDRSSR